MPTANANIITEAGVPYPAAIEIARQINAGTPNGKADRLIAVGITPMQATELAAQINNGVYSAHKLAMAMWPTALATIIKQQSA